MIVNAIIVYLIIGIAFSIFMGLIIFLNDEGVDLINRTISDVCDKHDVMLTNDEKCYVGMSTAIIVLIEYIVIWPPYFYKSIIVPIINVLKKRFGKDKEVTNE